MSWTKELPTKSGFYWYRVKKGRETVVEWDNSDGTIGFTNSDVQLYARPMATFETDEWDEFWSERLTPPSA